MPRFCQPLLIATLALLGGCDMLGIESAQTLAANKEADGKAVGSACRQAGRALEDCFALNQRSGKAAIFAGWREMNDYMRENKIADVPPQLGATAQAPADTAAAKPAAETPPDGKRTAHDS